jgi:predicted Zn-dependent peptidase
VCDFEKYVPPVKYKHVNQSYHTIIPEPYEDFEQSNISIAFPGVSSLDEKRENQTILALLFGGGMSSRLFQKIREELGLAYSVYSYTSQYKDNGVIEIYAGVNTSLRDLAVNAIIEQVQMLKKDGITEQEFARGKEQVKSAFIMGQESTGSQMLLYAKYLALLDKELDINQRIKRLENVTIKDVNEVIDCTFDLSTLATATVGSKRTPIKYN